MFKSYENLGWSVIPIEAQGKKPLIKWTKYQTKLPSAETLECWNDQYPNANIAIITGEVSDLVVLDVDTDEGREYMQKVGIPVTPTVKTAKGHHYYFKYPGYDIQNFVRKLPGIDLRGDGGYVVAPPSTHSSGVAYEWEMHPDDVEIAEIPKWLELIIKTEQVSTTPRLQSDEMSDIPEGERHNTLVSKAGLMRHGGFGRALIASTLLELNAACCKPPLDENEVLSIANSMQRYEPGVKLENLTDLGNARRLTVKYGKDIHYCPNWGKWLIWDGTVWEIDDLNKMQIYARSIASDIYHLEAPSIADEDYRKKVAMWALSSESRSKLESMVAIAQAEPEIPVRPDVLDADHYALNVANGTIDLRTGKLHQHKQSDMITKKIEVDYDPDAQCPKWLKFLNEIMAGDDTLIDFIQRALGYALTGDTSEQCMFILYGLGANGKTTLLQTISALLRTYAMQTPADTLLSKRHDGAIPNDIARLKGSRFVTACEVDDGRRLAESLVKQVTGGDKVTVRFLHREFFEYTPTYKIWLATNNKPEISGDDNAIWRRIHLIPFDVTIRDEDQDPRLLEKLQRELSGILAWLVQGCLDWQRVGLKPPNAVQRATAEYRDEQDIIGQFLDDCTFETGDGNTGVASSQLYDRYKDWSEKNGEAVMSQTMFSRRMKGFDYEKRTVRGARRFIGLALNNQALEDKFSSLER